MTDQLLHDWKFILFAATLVFNCGIMVASLGFQRVMIKQLGDCVAKLDDRQDTQELRLTMIETEHKLYHGRHAAQEL